MNITIKTIIKRSGERVPYELAKWQAQIAKVCEGVGQRVQKSVFECRVDRMQYEDLERRLLLEINDKEDNLRLYRLAEGRGCEVKEHGFFKATDFDAPLVV